MAAARGTLSIHSITTQRREAFYRPAALATFALGAALGDLRATSLHLGYLASGTLLGAVVLVVARPDIQQPVGAPLPERVRARRPGSSAPPSPSSKRSGDR